MFYDRWARNAGSWMGSFKPSSVSKFMEKYIPGGPVGAGVAMGIPLALAGWYGARPLSRFLARRMGGFAPGSPGLRNAYYQIDQTLPRTRALLAGTMGLLPGVLMANESYVSKKNDPAHGGWRSMFTWDRGGLNKSGSDAGYKNALMDVPSVPVDPALDLIWSDSYLTGKEKYNASLPFQHAAPDGTGVVSKADLIKGAVRAGFGGAAGYVVGSVLGDVFSAPPQAKKIMSWTGAVAGALKNTGVI